MIVRRTILSLMFLYVVHCKVFLDVPDNAQLRKDSDINLMKVLESLAPVTDDEDASVIPSSNGIERFRRQVKGSAPDTESASTNATKAAEQDSQESNSPAAPQETPAESVEQAASQQSDALPNGPELSSVEGNEPFKVPHPLTPQYTPQPPPPPPVPPPSPPPAPPVIVTTKITPLPAMIGFHNNTLMDSRFKKPSNSHVKLSQEQSSDEGSGETFKNNGLSADEASFISALHNTNEAKTEAPVASVLPGSEGAIQDENLGASGDEKIASGSGEAIEEQIPVRSEDGFSSGSESISEGSGETPSGEKRNEIEVETTSGTNFLSGDYEKESSGESEDSLPGSLGAFKGIEKIEKKAEDDEPKTVESTKSNDSQKSTESTPQSAVPQTPQTSDNVEVAADQKPQQAAVADQTPQENAAPQTTENVEVAADQKPQQAEVADQTHQEHAAPQTSENVKVAADQKPQQAEVADQTPQEIAAPQTTENVEVAADQKPQQAEAADQTPQENAAPQTTENVEVAADQKPQQAEAADQTPQENAAPQTTENVEVAADQKPQQAEAVDQTPQENDAPQTTENVEVAADQKPQQAEVANQTPQENDAPQMTENVEVAADEKPPQAEVADQTPQEIAAPQTAENVEVAAEQNPQQAEVADQTPQEIAAPQTTENVEVAADQKPQQAEAADQTPQENAAPQTTENVEVAADQKPQQAEAADQTPQENAAPQTTENVEVAADQKPQQAEAADQTPQENAAPQTTENVEVAADQKPQQAEITVQTPQQTAAIDQEADLMATGSGMSFTPSVTSESFPEIQTEAAVQGSGSDTETSSGSGQETSHTVLPYRDPNYIKEEQPEPRQPTEKVATQDSAITEDTALPLVQSTAQETVSEDNAAQSSSLESGSGSGSGSDSLFMSDSEEQLPGSVGAMGPNLMTMNNLPASSGDNSDEASASGSGSATTINSDFYKKDNIATLSTVKSDSTGIESDSPKTDSGSGGEDDLNGGNDFQPSEASGEVVSSNTETVSGSNSGVEVSTITSTKETQQSDSNSNTLQTVVTSTVPKDTVLSAKTSEEDGSAKQSKTLPGSLGVEDSISFSGSSAISEGSSSASSSLDSDTDDIEGEGSADDSEQLPQYKKTLEPESYNKGDDITEGSAEIAPSHAQEESQPALSLKLPPFDLVKDSSLKAALGAAAISSAPMTFGSGFEEEGSGLEGSGLTGTLELTPVTNPEDAVLKASNNEQSDKTSGESGISEGFTKSSASEESKQDTPLSGSTYEEEQPEVEVEDEEIVDDGWPSLGDTVDQQMLDHFMISQILEQNLTLFYGGLSGRSGTVGPPGPPGQLGDIGTTGEPGLPGTSGDVGAPGSDGVLGPHGPPGPPGEYGKKGPRGLQGPHGTSGSSGAPGVAGIRGYSGAPGTDSIMPNCSYVCEGERTWLQCKQYEMLKVNRVFWGREDNKMCPTAPQGLTVDKPCETDPEQAMKKVNSQCKNQQACEIVASNVFFDEPSCKNTYKYLKLCYECVPDTANAVDSLTAYGKRKKRGTKLQNIMSKIRAKEVKKYQEELWRRPYRGLTF